MGLYADDGFAPAILCIGMVLVSDLARRRKTGHDPVAGQSLVGLIYFLMDQKISRLSLWES